MKRAWLALALALAAWNAGAQQSVTMNVHESRTLQVFGATAAWAIDSIVDAAAQNGTVTLFGRAAGRTRVVVVSLTGETTFEVHVLPQAGRSQQPRSDRQDHAVAEGRYSSATRELQSAVAITQERSDGRSELQLRTSHHTRSPQGDRAETSVQGATIRLLRGTRELTIFDREVDHSPLTLSSTPLRGLHYVDDHWRVHAGYTTYTVYRSLFLPVERELVAGAAYEIPTSSRSSVTPGFFHYDEKGSVASLVYDYGDGGQTALRAELGWSGGVGAAVQLSRETSRDLLRANVRYRPESFARPSAASPSGLLGDALWNRTWNRGSALSVNASVSDVADIRALGASADLDQRLTDVLSLTAGASWGAFGATRSLMVPAGLRADFARGGLGLLYRHARSTMNRGGHGARMFGRVSRGRFYASAYADWQENAPTLELILRDAPALAIALDDLGITATSPSDIARALRDHAALSELGFIDGMTIDLSPVRRQYGVELAWLGAGAPRQQLRFRFTRNETEGVSGGTRTTIASLSVARRLGSGTELHAGYTWWKIARAGEPAQVQPFVEAGIRQQFDSLPAIGSGTIAGVVFSDEDLDGSSDGTPAMAEIELDGLRTTRTANDGTFSFGNVAHGSHHLVARVADRPEAYFTTPSRVEAVPGDRIAFGVAFTPARLIGSVVSDAGESLAGVRLMLSRGANRQFATSDSSGSYTFAAAPGEWQLAVISDSVVSGYSLRGIESRQVVLSRTQPLRISQEIPAIRSIAGEGATPLARIEVPALGKTIQADAEGRFALRNLPAGKIRLLTNGISREVEIPAGPARIAVALGSVADAPATTPALVASGERTEAMRWFVQLGAYRVRANAVDAVARARREGVQAAIETRGAFALVRTSPYPSRHTAAAAAAVLTRAGLECAVMSRK